VLPLEFRFHWNIINFELIVLVLKMRMTMLVSLTWIWSQRPNS